MDHSALRPINAEMASEMREAKMAFLAMRPMAKYARVANAPIFTFAAMSRGRIDFSIFFLPRPKKEK